MNYDKQYPAEVLIGKNLYTAIQSCPMKFPNADVIQSIPLLPDLP